MVAVLLLAISVLVACTSESDQTVSTVDTSEVSTSTRAPATTSSSLASTVATEPVGGCTVPDVTGLPFEVGQTSEEIGFLKQIVSENWMVFWDIFRPPLDQSFDASFKELVILVQGDEGLPETGVVDAYTYRELVWPRISWLAPCD